MSEKFQNNQHGLPNPELPGCRSSSGSKMAATAFHRIHGRCWGLLKGIDCPSPSPGGSPNPCNGTPLVSASYSARGELSSTMSACPAQGRALDLGWKPLLGRRPLHRPKPLIPHPVLPLPCLSPHPTGAPLACPRPGTHFYLADRTYRQQ